MCCSGVRWLQSLKMAPEVRDVVVEQIHVIKEAFKEILRYPYADRSVEFPA